MLWRLLGVRVGRRLFDDGAGMSEKNIVTIGDDVTLNAGAYIQCHSQEDDAFKSDRSAIGSGCTVGVGAMVHYGVTMGDGAVLAPDSFLMKGEEVRRTNGGAATPPGDAAHSTVRPARRTRPPSPPRRPRDDTLPPEEAHGDHTDQGPTRTGPGREFWRACSRPAGPAIPRWTLDPVPGVAEHEVTIPERTCAAVRRVADELGRRCGRCCWPRTRRCSPRCPASATW